jgi:hypothetical protein
LCRLVETQSPARTCVSVVRWQLPSREPPAQMAALAMHQAMLLPELSASLAAPCPTWAKANAGAVSPEAKVTLAIHLVSIVAPRGTTTDTLRPYPGYRSQPIPPLSGNLQDNFLVNVPWCSTYSIRSVLSQSPLSRVLKKSLSHAV